MDSWVEGVAFSPNGFSFAASTHDNMIRVYEFKSSSEFQEKKINWEGLPFTKIIY